MRKLKPIVINRIQNKDLPNWWFLDNNSDWSLFNYINRPLFTRCVKELIVVRHTNNFMEEMYMSFVVYNPFKILYFLFQVSDSSMKRQQILSIMSLNFDEHDIDLLMKQPEYRIQTRLHNGNVVVFIGDDRLKFSLYDEWCKLNGKPNYKKLFKRLVHFFRDLF